MDKYDLQIFLKFGSRRVNYLRIELFDEVKKLSAGIFEILVEILLLSS